jgi:predicted nucleic-acid-binding Zn-ribbon protein
MSESPPPRLPGKPDDAEKQAQAQRALTWITSHWPSPQICPICGSQSWAINDLVEMRPYRGGALIMGGPLYVMVPVMCQVCSYTLFFNAVTSGVLAQVSPPPEPEDSGGAEPGSAS